MQTYAKYAVVAIGALVIGMGMGVVYGVRPSITFAATCSLSPINCPTGEKAYYSPMGSGVCEYGGFYCAKEGTIQPSSGSTKATIAPATQSISSKLLALGAKGSAVLTLQNQLVALGYLSADNATGYFGKLTQAAVKRFQRDNNLEPVGYIGPRTKSVLASAASGKPSKNLQQSVSMLSFGSRSSAVTAIQKKLIFLGYLAPDSGTGYFGRLTQTAVAQFQRDQSIEPTGSVDAVTSTALEQTSSEFNMHSVTVNVAAGIGTSNATTTKSGTLCTIGESIISSCIIN